MTTKAKNRRHRKTQKRDSTTSSGHRQTRKRSSRPASKRWVATVKTDSTHPPAGLFNRSAATIARTLASKRVSPKGPASGMRMLNYYMNRAGRNLTASRRAELSKAKTLLSRKVGRAKRARRTKSRRVH